MIVLPAEFDPDSDSIAPRSGWKIFPCWCSILKKYNDAYGKNIAGLTRRAQAIMLQHAWPGNVKELENVISSACITAMGDFIDIADFPDQLQHRGGGAGSRDDWRPLSWKK